ncbi:hypothetical protein CC80DRAFT_514467 [Byssothecium circinans]|uniref:DDE-1 domain-containing protein n=1 Tax=Byssothecium circinans TaxID=147558 RepID=A0A6A5U1X5_9PLEO|nr:hypothetical protein CC80DRAFT_514467 [Byssothecium circinans]
MDRVRHQADSGKIEGYDIEPRHTYNMDEKGFLTRVIGRSKRIFSKAMWDRGEVKLALQDGNREWITILACVCADGIALPPGLLFAAANNALQSAWVEDIEARKYEYTKAKARRAYRLLILDGHGSHVTMDFINYLLFKPLLLAYSKALTTYLHEAQGLLLPYNPSVILQRFIKSTPELQDLRESSTSVLSGKDWLKIETLVRKAVRDEGSKEKKSKPLDLQQRKEYHGGAVFWSPRKLREARARKKAEQASAKLRKLQEKEERERLRAKKKEEKERIAAGKEAEKQRKIQEKENSKKATQTSQKGKRKASKPAAAPKQKKKQRVVVAEDRGDRGSEMARDLASTTTTRRGRNIKLPAKFQ